METSSQSQSDFVLQIFYKLAKTHHISIYDSEKVQLSDDLLHPKMSI